MKLEPEIIQAIKKLNEYFEKRNIPYILIGAMVPFFLIDLKEKNSSGYGIRPTIDLDYSIKVESWKDYEQIKQDLIANGFEQHEGEPEHRLYLGNVPVDLIPYGENILENDILIWKHSGNRMNLASFDELFRHVQYEKIQQNIIIPIITLPLFVYSKILTHLDRRLNKDLIDIIYIIEHYEEISVSERRFEVVGEDNLTYETSGAFLLGRDIKKIIPESKLKLINAFIALFKDEYSPAVQEIVRDNIKEEKEILALMQAFQKGFSR